MDGSRIRKEKLRIKKYPDTCGRGLTALFSHIFKADRYQLESLKPSFIAASIFAARVHGLCVDWPVILQRKITDCSQQSSCTCDFSDEATHLNGSVYKTYNDFRGDSERRNSISSHKVCLLRRKQVR